MQRDSFDKRENVRMAEQMLAIMGLTLPVPERGYMACKVYALDHVDFSEDNYYDSVLLNLMRNSKLKLKVIKNREDTGDRRLLRFQASNFGPAVHGS